jgi:hypothetical protein
MSRMPAPPRKRLPFEQRAFSQRSAWRKGPIRRPRPRRPDGFPAVRLFSADDHPVHSRRVIDSRAWHRMLARPLRPSYAFAIGMCLVSSAPAYCPHRPTDPKEDCI